jgi:alginate O-acetyltransferase complex protein AlgI
LLFNSFAYLAIFLPFAFLLDRAIVTWLPLWRNAALLTLSIAFYGYWDWRFTPLIIFSILLNWSVARCFSRREAVWIIYAAIAANLAVLIVFKYLHFFIGLLPAHWKLPNPEIPLPLGISFFTFHNVMYLTDLRRRQAPQYRSVDFGLYIAFFPQVLAGPLVRWREVMHQFQTWVPKVSVETYSRALMLITLGLCQKVMLGDNLARLADPVFSAVEKGLVSPRDAWLATLAFTFQIFFDFSGYTDMAIGSAMLFGITLPQNFNRPYLAWSLQDFWRRWHMTLSRFLRDYLYIPLGGNRHGLLVQLFALFATMTLGGLWHGAGLTFILWGVCHGVGLGVEVIWRKAKLTMPSLVSGPLTFLFVVLCWVLFRAHSLAAAKRLYILLAWSDGGNHILDPASAAIIVVIGAAFAFLLPNTTELVSRIEPKPVYAAAFGLLAATAILTLNSSESFAFIYFHF